MSPPSWLYFPAAAAAAPFAPSDLASLRAWYKADAITGLSNNDPVGSWTDSSGGGYTLTASGSNRPTYKTSTINSLPVVEFNATHWLAASTASHWKFLHDPTGSSVFVVLRYTRAARMAFLWTSPFSSVKKGWTLVSNLTNQNAWNIIPASGNSWNVLNQTANNTLPINTNNIVGVIADPNNGTASSRSSTRINGGNATTANTETNAPSTANPDSPLTLGRSGDSSTVGLEGWIAEVVICNAILSSSDRQKVEGYLAHKWGLQGNLPSNHPYKNAPPEAP
jgi:hypothetical protein